MESGERVGPFELIERIEVPEPGCWYRGQRIGVSNRRPADALIKRLEGQVGPDQRDALQKEHAALVALQDDPRIPTPIGHYDGAAAIAYEFVEGYSLEAWAEVRNEDGLAMSRATLLDIAIELAEAIKSSHHRGRHHGHLSPSVIWLRADGGLTVWGFGPGADEVPDEVWQAPERARGEGIRGATDLWSLGAILAGLITGRAPWEGADPASAARRGDAGAFIAPIAATWPAMARLLRQLLDNRPQNRPASIHPVQKELLALSRKEGLPSDRAELGARLADFLAPPEPEPVPEPEPLPEPEPVPAPLASADLGPADVGTHDAPTELDPVVPSVAVVRPAHAAAPQRGPLPNEALPVVRPLQSIDLERTSVQEEELSTDTFADGMDSFVSEAEPTDASYVEEDDDSEEDDDDGATVLIRSTDYMRELEDASPTATPPAIAQPEQLGSTNATVVPPSAELPDELATGQAPDDLAAPPSLDLGGPALGTSTELPNLIPERTPSTVERVAPVLVALMVCTMLVTMLVTFAR